MSSSRQLLRGSELRDRISFVSWDEEVRHIRVAHPGESFAGWLPCTSDYDEGPAGLMDFDSATGTLLFITEADKVTLNEDSSCAFAQLPSLESIDFEGFDASKVRRAVT